MANKRISTLDDISLVGGTSTPGLTTSDIIPVTDVDDTTGSLQGTTKKVTVANLVAVAPQGDLESANNLSDLANAATARTNLGLGTAATTASTDYATAAQGATADSATQPGDNISTLTNDSGFIDSSGAPVQSVAGRTGVVTLSNTDVSGLGTASTQNVGTANGNVVQLDVTGLPAVDGSQLTNVSGTDSTKLAIASNLSDLANAATARTNLGLGTAATTASTDYATAAQGATADTATQPGDNISTLTNDSGFITGLTAGELGDFDFDDNAILGFGASVNTPTITANAYTVTDADNGKVLALDNGATAMNVNINTGLPAGFNCSFIQTGSGQVTFAGTATLNNRQSHTKINAQYGVASIVAYATDTYILAGDTTA